jgi:hypothetical protein
MYKTKEFTGDELDEQVINFMTTNNVNEVDLIKFPLDAVKKECPHDRALLIYKELSK